MRAFRGAWRTAFLAFFVSHVPITILIDAQALFAPWYPGFLRALVEWYCGVSGDVLMAHPSPGWFRALVAGEVLLQLPFFVVAARTIAGHDDKRDGPCYYPPWFRTASLVYGSHTATTMIPILASFWGSRGKEMTGLQVAATTTVYAPYLFFPLALVWFAAAEDSVPPPKRS